MRKEIEIERTCWHYQERQQGSLRLIVLERKKERKKAFLTASLFRDWTCFSGCKHPFCPQGMRHICCKSLPPRAAGWALIFLSILDIICSTQKTHRLLQWRRTDRLSRSEQHKLQGV